MTTAPKANAKERITIILNTTILLPPIRARNICHQMITHQTTDITNTLIIITFESGRTCEMHILNVHGDMIMSTMKVKSAKIENMMCIHTDMKVNCAGHAHSEVL